MNEPPLTPPAAPAGTAEPTRDAVSLPPAGPTAEVIRLLRRRGEAHGTDVLAGLIASVVTIAYCLSFAALIFQGVLRPGLSTGLWAFLVGTALTGVIVAFLTSLPPVDAGPDNPSVAVMSVLAATVAAQLVVLGAAPAAIVRHVLLAISIAVLMTGIALYLIGRLRLGQLLRFIPYPVIAGFLAASGWLLLMGAVSVITGRSFTLGALPATLTGGDGLKVLIAMGFAVGVYLIRQSTGSVFILPVAFIATAAGLDIALWATGTRAGWFIAGAGALVSWQPVVSLAEGGIHWLVVLRSSAEIAAIVAVVLMTLLLDLSSLEVARSRMADIDREFRNNGIANMVCAFAGGFGGNLSMSASRLLEEMGSRSRLSGIVSAVGVAAVVVTGIELPAWVPTPVLGGLLMYMGLVVLIDTFRSSPARRSWMELGLALAIMLAIVQLGYLGGVMLGFVGACLMFAFSYSRVGVIRRHLTRAAVSSDVERAAEIAEVLGRNGERIHIFWLTGFIFFGSSNGVFEAIRASVEARANEASAGGRVRFLVLDCSAVSGFDTSAVLSLVKLRNYADEKGITIVYSGLGPALLLAFEHARLYGAATGHRVAPTRTEAIEWCEERLLEELGRSGASTAAFEAWLTREMGEGADRLAGRFLQRRAMKGGEQLYAQGGPSDAIDLVAEGSIAVMVSEGGSRPVRVRRMARATVVGEMGFFRGRPRAASVHADGPTVIYTLTRAAYERMRAEEPDLAARFLEFIVRALSDRVEAANREIAALM